MGDELGFTEERRSVLESEFQLSNLHYGQLFAKTIVRSSHSHTNTHTHTHTTLSDTHTLSHVHIHR